MPDSHVPHSVHEIPGPARFTVRGQSFQLDLLDTIYDLHDLAEQIRKQNGDHRAYLAAMIERLQLATGVALTCGEADWLNDHLEIEFAVAKKKAARCYRRRAELAEFYAFDTSRLSEWELLGFRENLRRNEARRTRRELGLRPDVRLSVDQVYDLVLAETEDEAQASKAASSYAAALLRKGQTPE